MLSVGDSELAAGGEQPFLVDDLSEATVDNDEDDDDDSGVWSSVVPTRSS